MLNYDDIGRRIKENRKYLLGVSQEKMAEDLFMYQADISNLEKAKAGSGITDLSKLETIAEYFNIPLETLLFGGDKKMEKYYGLKMQLNKSEKKPNKEQDALLRKLLGRKEGDNPLDMYVCGPYSLFTAGEWQNILGGENTAIDGKSISSSPPLLKYHTYIFYGNELVAAMTSATATIMQHIHQPSLMHLKTLIPFDVLDVTDVWRTVNPYWALAMFEQDPAKKEEYEDSMYKRMDELRAAGESRPVVYMEGVFVREDCRRNGIFRMYTDFIKEFLPGCIIWLNMEPVSGSVLESEYDMVTSYDPSELGQLNLNASIAERVGFTVDPDTWHRQAAVMNSDGTVSTEVVLVRKCAYYIPEEIKQILKDDRDLVALGRSMQKVAQQKDSAKDEDQIVIDYYDDIVDGYHVIEWAETYTGGKDIGKKLHYYAAKRRESDEYKVGVSYKSVMKNGVDHPGQIEQYSNIEDAAQSESYDKLKNILGMVFAEDAIKEAEEQETQDAIEEDESDGADNKEEIGLSYMKELGFKPLRSFNKLKDSLAELSDKETAENLLNMMDIRSKEEDRVFYKAKNQTLDISMAISSAFDADLLRKACNWIYDHNDFFEGDILEVGCDCGIMTCFLARLFPEARITAIDRCPEAIENAKQLARKMSLSNITFVAGELKDIEGQYDTVFSMRTVQENYEHHEDVMNDLGVQADIFKKDLVPYAEELRSKLSEDGHLVCIELFGRNALFLGWMEALYEAGLMFLPQLYDEITFSEYGADGEVQAFVAVPTKMVLDPEETSIKEMFDIACSKYLDFTLSEYHGWDAKIIYDNRRGDLIEGYLTEFPKEKSRTKVALWTHITDPTALVQFFNKDGDAHLVIYDISQKEEALTIMHNAIDEAIGYDKDVRITKLTE